MPSCRWVFQCSTQPRRGMAQRDGSLAPCRTDSNRLNGNGGHLPALPASQAGPNFMGGAWHSPLRAGGGALSLMNAGLLASQVLHALAGARAWPD